MGLTEGKTAVEKYRADDASGLYTHPVLMETLNNSLSTAGYNSVEEFFNEVIQDNLNNINNTFSTDYQTIEDFWDATEEDNEMSAYWNGLWR